MTSQDEHNHGEIHTGPVSFVARYAFALVATGAGLAITLAIFESDVSDQPIYAPLIGAVALSAWFGGFGPAAVAIAVGWVATFVLLVTPRGEITFGDTEDMTRWWVNLATAVVIAGVSALLRSRQEHATRALISTRASFGEIESLQQLSVALSAAVSSADVTGVLTSHLDGIVGSQGAVLALVDGDRLALVDATGIAARVDRAGMRHDLDGSSLLAAAVGGNSSSGSRR